MKKSFALCVLAIAVLVVSLSAAHLCIANGSCNVARSHCAAQQAPGHGHEGNAQKCSFCGSDVRLCGITANLSEDKGLLTAASTVPSIAAQADVIEFVSSVAVSPGARYRLADAIDIADEAPRPIYLTNLSLIC